MPTTTTASTDYNGNREIRISCYKDRMVSIDEELTAAKAAQTVISALSISGLNSNVVAGLRSAASVATRAITTFPSEGPLNEARHTVGIALPELIHGPLTQEKIDKAKGAIGVWTVEQR